MHMKVSEEELIRIANVYNTQGKSAAISLLRDEYQYQNISNMWMRLRSRKLIENDTVTESDAKKNNSFNPDDVFISMDELCSTSKNKEKNKSFPTIKKTVSMEKLIQDLIGERLLEISKYIILNVTDKTMIVDKTTLSDDGYKLIFQ